MNKSVYLMFFATTLSGCTSTTTAAILEADHYHKISSIEEAKAFLTKFPNSQYKEQLLATEFPLVTRISYQHQQSKRYQLRQQDFLYDDKGILKAQRDTLGFGETYTYHYKYNAENQLVDKSVLNNTSLQNTVSYQYDAQGQKIKEIDTYTHGGSIEHHFEYNNEGRLLNHYLLRNSKKVESYRYFYDSDGKKSANTSVSSTNRLGTYKDSHEYSYDSKGCLSEEGFSSQYSAADESNNVGTGMRQFIYDDKCRLIEERYEYKGSRVYDMTAPYYLNTTIIYVRDDNGLLLEEQHRQSTAKGAAQELDKTLRYQYTYLLMSDIVQALNK